MPGRNKEAQPQQDPYETATDAFRTALSKSRMTKSTVPSLETSLQRVIGTGLEMKRNPLDVFKQAQSLAGEASQTFHDRGEIAAHEKFQGLYDSYQPLIEALQLGDEVQAGVTQIQQVRPGTRPAAG
jgi:hypothetical protein